MVVVSRLTEEGWLEEQTMGVLRARLHKRLQEADAHGRYRLLYPYVPDLERPNLLNVHSKVLVMDDELCSVGSANFNNRSMGFDTECNIAVEARGEERIRRLIAGLRDRLLAEHLGAGIDQVASEIGRQSGSLIKTIDALKRPGRTWRRSIRLFLPKPIVSSPPARSSIRSGPWIRRNWYRSSSFRRTAGPWPDGSPASPLLSLRLPASPRRGAGHRCTNGSPWNRR